MACQQTPAHRRASRCSTRVRTWNLRRNRAPLCRLSHRASMGPRGVEPRPTGLQPAAPPATLRSHCLLVGPVGLEPTVPCSQSRWDGRFPTTRWCCRWRRSVVAYPPPESNRDVRGHGGLSSARIPDFARRAWCCVSPAGFEPAASRMRTGRPEPLDHGDSSCAARSVRGSNPRSPARQAGVHSTGPTEQMNRSAGVPGRLRPGRCGGSHRSRTCGSGVLPDACPLSSSPHSPTGCVEFRVRRGAPTAE